MNWLNFISLSKRNTAQSAPFNSVLSIRYKTPDNSYRFDAYFWSNLIQGAPYPVRLDILGAFGAANAKILETQQSFLLYDVENNSAYVTSNSPQAMMQSGIPLPVRLGELALLLNGRYLEFFLPEQKDIMPRFIAANDKLESIYYIPSGPLKGELVLDYKGQPVSWAEKKHNGWRFELNYLEGVEAFTLPGPSRMRVIHPEGYSVTMQIKTMHRQEKPFTPDQLDLILPDTATVKHSQS
jgi:hypothetical protein